MSSTAIDRPSGASPRPDLRTMSLKERREAARQRMGGQSNGHESRMPSEVDETESPRDSAVDQPPSRPVRRPDRRREPIVVQPLQQPPGVYYMIMAIVAVFVMLGLVMVLSATSMYQMSLGRSPYWIFYRQIAWAGVGLVAALIISRIPYQKWKFFVYPAYAMSLALMIAALVPGLGMTVNGAHSWLRMGPLSFQPSELMKLTLIAALAVYFDTRQHQIADPRYGLYPLALMVGAAVGVCFAQGDLGSAIVIGTIGLAVGLIAGIPLVHIGGLSLGGIGLAAAGVITDPRRLNRIVAFLDPSSTKNDLSWQTWQSQLSIANGGLVGSGIGGSRAKLGYLPYAHSDFIFAVVADELGVIGTVAVFGGFMLLVYCGMQVALAAPDRNGMLLASGISTWFGVQALIHLGGVSGAIPVTGLTLPFFSAGGSSLLVSMVAGAALLNIARRAVTMPDEPVQRKARR